jgi:hypothetical protein
LHQPFVRPEEIVPAYRLYRRGPDARFRDFTPIEASGDDDAIARANFLANGEPAQLWIDNRLVTTLRPKPA